MINELRVIYSSAILQMKQSFSRSMFKFCMLVYPILYGFILYMLYKNGEKENIIAYAILGSALATLWGTISFSSAGDINRERFMGALEVIFNSPSKFINVMLGKVLGNTLLGLISVLISISFISITFKVHINVAHIKNLLIVLTIGIISFIAIGMALASLLTISRSTTILMNCLDYPILILSGSAFPIDFLPQWAQNISFFLAPSHFLILVRMCILGIDDIKLYSKHLYSLIFLTILYTISAIHFFKVIDKKARKEATLAVV